MKEGDKNMQIKGRIFGTDAREMTVEAGTITAVGIEREGETADFGDAWILPGFIDIHTHGAMGYDTMDASDAAMKAMKKHMATHGVTAFCPTTVTMPKEALLGAIRAAKQERLGDGAEILGVHLEGPFFHEKYKGAQNPAYLRTPDTKELAELFVEDFVRIVSLAPELPRAKEAIEYITKCGIVAAAGHTGADYDTFMAGVDAGISHITHLYNGMAAFGHRAPNVIGGALSTDAVNAELICDGQHVHPAAALAAIRAKGADRIVLISDSMRAAGMPDGIYELGGQTVFVKEGKATLENGALAGGTSNVFACFQNVVRWGIPMEDAVKMVTENPAKIVGALKKGKIAAGYDADLLVVNAQLELMAVFVRGKRVEI